MAKGKNRGVDESTQTTHGEITKYHAPHSHAAEIVKLIICSVGIFGCYGLYGLAQEEIYIAQKDGTKFTDTGLVLLAQCGFNALVGFVVVVLLRATSKNKAGPKMQKSDFFGKLPTMSLSPRIFTVSAALATTSFSYLAAMYCSNWALQFVNYPMQALAKSCKMVPVLIGQALAGKKHGYLKYICVVLVTAGIASMWFC